MSNLKKYMTLSLLLVATLGMSAQQALPLQSGSIQVNGIAAAGEYNYFSSDKNIDLSLRRLDATRLAFNLKVKTTGWVAIGFGSQRMNGAHILIGYYDSKPVYEEHVGVFNLHRKTTDKVLIESVMLEADGFTNWEGIIDSTRFTSSGKLELILAYGSRDNLTSKHQAYRSLVLNLP